MLKAAFINPVFFISLFLFSGIGVSAQQGNYNIVHYTTDQGLPQNSITAISFDKAGYCWLGTEMGLVRFDGRAFKIFNSEKASGLKLSRIRFSTTDTSGNIYIQTDKMEQLVIDVSKTGTAPYPVLINHPAMWLPTTAGYAIKSPSMVKWATEEIQNKQFNGYNYSTYNLQSGGIYCVYEKELLYRNNEKFIQADILNPESDLNYFPVGNLFLLLEKKQQLIRAFKNGAVQKNIVSIHGPLQQSSAYQKGIYSCHTSFNQSYIYCGNTLYGIYIKDGQVYSKILLEDIRIPVVSKIYYNAEQGKYYIGSLVSGLYIITASEFHYPAQGPDAVNEGFYSQVIANNGDILCQRYVYRKDGSYTKLLMNQNVGASLYLNQQQQLYYGNEPVLYKYDITTGRNSKLADLDSRPSSLYRDKNDSNVTIVSTTFSIGKLRRDSLSLLKKLSGVNVIMSTWQTGKDSFLIATQKGVKWYDLAHNIIYRSALDSLYIRSIYSEPGGRVWISTYGSGFYLFDKEKIYALPDNSFAALKTIHAFIDDGRGNFWLPTNNGLYKVSKNSLLAYAKGAVKEVYFYSYSVSDNLRTNEFNGGCTPAYLWTKDSMLSLPSIEGLVQFYPHRIAAILPVKKIYVEEVRLNNNIIDLPDSNGLVLKPDYGKLTIMVSSPYFGNKANMQMVYMTEGIDRDWQPVPSDGGIVLSRMPAGRHNLVVKKLTGQGVSEYDSLTFSLEVMPRFYNTWWFYSLVFAAVVLTIFAFVRIRTNILKERNRKLQEIITAQTDDLNKTVRQLKKSEEELKESNEMKDRVTTMVLHDLRSPIRFLDIVSNHVAKGYKKMLPADIAQKLLVLSAGTASLNSFTEQFFAWATSQHKDFKIVVQDFLLQQILNELQELYNDITGINNNELVIIPTGIMIRSDKNILSALLRNLLDNANKNTSGGTITLSAKRQGSKIILSIADTGAGLTKEMAADFYNNTGSTGTSGNGSIIVINLLEKIQGKLTIETESAKGTTFHVELNDHLSSQSDVPADQAPIKN